MTNIDPNTPTEDELKEIVSRSVQDSNHLLHQLLKVHETPLDAFVVMVLTTGILGKSLGMARQDLLEGLGAAFDSLEEAGGHNVH